MAIDFSKLNDPAWREQCRKEREAEQEKLDAREKRHREALDVCFDPDNYEKLSAKDRSLVRSVRERVNTYGVVSGDQEKWLFDIEKRLTSPASSKFLKP